jgi:hypothetical protein
MHTYAHTHTHTHTYIRVCLCTYVPYACVTSRLLWKLVLLMFTNCFCEIAICFKSYKCNDYLTRTRMFVSACNSSVDHRSINYFNESGKIEIHTLVQYIFHKALTLSITRLHKERSSVLACWITDRSSKFSWGLLKSLTVDSYR